MFHGTRDMLVLSMILFSDGFPSKEQDCQSSDQTIISM